MRLLLQSSHYVCDLVVDVAAFLHKVTDLLDRIHNCGVVSVAKQCTNFRKRHSGLLPAQIHGNLTGDNNGLGSRFAK
jgi:hypothetical protein